MSLRHALAGFVRQSFGQAKSRASRRRMLPQGPRTTIELLELREVLIGTDLVPDPANAGWLTYDDGSICTNDDGDNGVRGDRKVIEVGVSGLVLWDGTGQVPTLVRMTYGTYQFSSFLYSVASPVEGKVAWAFDFDRTHPAFNDPARRALESLVPLGPFTMSLQAYYDTTTELGGTPVGSPVSVSGERIVCPPVLISVDDVTIPEGERRIGLVQIVKKAPAEAVTYSLTGPDADKFAIATDSFGNQSPSVNLVRELDYEAKSDHKYTVTVVATDSHGHTGSDTFVVTVTDVAPALQITDPTYNAIYNLPSHPGYLWREKYLTSRSWSIVSQTGTVMASGTTNTDSGSAWQAGSSGYTGSLASGSYEFRVSGTALERLGIEYGLSDSRPFILNSGRGPTLNVPNLGTSECPLPATFTHNLKPYASDPDPNETLTFSLVSSSIAGVTVSSAGLLTIPLSTVTFASVYPITVEVRDSTGLKASDTFEFSITSAPAPEPTLPRLAAVSRANADRVMEAADKEHAVTVEWNDVDEAMRYDWELWRFDGIQTAGTTKGYTRIGGGQVDDTKKPPEIYTHALGLLSEAYYAFFVRAIGCGYFHSEWKGVTFVVVENGHLDPDWVEQRNNFEDPCECGTVPPGETIGAAAAQQGTGDVVLPVADIFGQLGGVLSSFLLPTYISGGSTQPTLFTAVPFPAAPDQISADIELQHQNDDVSPPLTNPPASGPLKLSGTRGLVTVSPESNELLTRREGLAALRVDPAKLNDGNGNSMAAIPSGNYVADTRITALLPKAEINEKRADPVNMHFVGMKTALNYRAKQDRTFGRSVGISGMSRLLFDSNGISLYRENGTSVRFKSSAGGGWVTPNGSFSQISSVDVAVENPLDPARPNRAAYKIAATSGLVQLFSSDGLLLETCQPDGEILRFGYEDRKADGSRDDVSRVLRVNTRQTLDFAWSAGAIQSVTDWVGRVWSYTYNTDGLLESVTGPSPGNSKPAPKVMMSWEAEVAGQTTSRLLSYSYTDTAASFLERTEIDWDQHGNVRSVRRVGTQDGDASRTTNFDSTESRQMSKFRLDQADAPLTAPWDYETVTYPDGSSARMRVDDFGNPLLLERTLANYAGNTKITTTFKRDVDGLPLEIGPTHQTSSNALSTILPATIYAYDEKGRTTQISFADGTTESWTYAADAAASDPSTYTDRVNRLTTYQYDATGFPTRIQEFAGGTLVATTSMTWLAGHLRTKVTTDPNGNGGSGLAMENYYDGHLNLIHSRTASASGTSVPAASVGDTWISFGYDSLDNPDWITVPYQPAALVTSGGRTIPDGSDTKLQAALGDISADVFGNVLSFTTPVPSPGKNRLTSTWVVDAVGRMLSATEPGTTATITRSRFTSYNSFGELKQQVFPDPDGTGGLGVPSTVYRYDIMGNLSETQLRDNTTVVSHQLYRFDSLGRLRSVSLNLPATSAGSSSDFTYFQYDAAGRTIRTDQPVGRAGAGEGRFLFTQKTIDDKTNTVTTSVTTSDTAFALSIEPLVETYDGVGRLLSAAQGGLTTAYQYFDGNTWSGTGTLLRMTDQRGQVWWQKAGPTGLLKRTQTPDPDGTGPLTTLDTQYKYDSRSNVDAITEATGTVSRTTDYAFDFRDQLTSVMTPAPSAGLPGLTTSYTRDQFGRVLTETSPSGAQLIRTWGDDGLLSKITRDDNDPTTQDLWFESYAYDNLNRVQHVTTPVGFSSVFYSNLGTVSRELLPDPDGTGPLPRPSTIYRYNTGVAGQFLRETEDTNGSRTTYAFDSAGRMIEQNRPVSLNPATTASGSDWTTVYSNGTPSATPTERWNYDAAGQLRSFVDASGNSILYSYDSLMRLREARGQGVSASSGDTLRKASWEYSTTNGDLISATDALGRKTVYSQYDNLGRPTESQRLLGTVVNDVTRQSYDGFGRLASVTSLAGVTGREMTTTFGYDLLDRQVSQLDAQGGVRQWVWDARGFLQKFDDESRTTTYVHYDNLGRLDATWLQGFSQSTGTRYTFDVMDRTTTKTDPSNAVTTWAYDALGRVTQQTDPTLAAGSPATVLSWDADGNLAAIRDPNGNMTEYRYDHRNRIREDVITLNGTAATREYWYDDTDHVTRTKDRNQNWRKFTFDFAFGAGDNYRLRNETWLDGQTETQRITWNYQDSAANGLLPTEVTDQGNLATSANATSRVSFQYDGLGRTIRTTDWLDAATKSKGFELQYTYGDGVDRRTTTAGRFFDFNLSTGTETASYQSFRNTYAWDTLNRVTMVKQESPTTPTAASWTTKAAQTKTVNIGYFADGSISTLSRTQGAGSSLTPTLLTTYSRVADGSLHEGRLSTITHSNLTSTTSSRSYTYAWDVNGRVSSLQTNVAKQTWQYDATGQVTGATSTNASQPAESYAWDLNGNRVGTGTVTGPYNRLLEDATYRYEYDAEGNRTRRTEKATGIYEEYTWDLRQRLTSVTRYSAPSVAPASVDGGQTAAAATPPVIWKVVYEYDGLDRRIRRTATNSAGTVTQKQRYLYDTNVADGITDEVVLILDEMLTGLPYQQQDHLFLNGPEVDQVFSDEYAANGILWYLQDAQNTVRDVATFAYNNGNQRATVRNHLEYDSFGNLLSRDNPSTATANDGALPGTETQYAPQRSYTGREPDTLTGMIYYRARWYDPKPGRFISEDPLAFSAGDTNLNRYVGNSTPNAVDPLGLWNESGHFYTVYNMARIAGHNHQRAKMIAYWTQYTDEVNAYDALFMFFKHKRDTYQEAASQVDATVEDISTDEWEDRVQSCLHQLHGGNMRQIDSNRSQLARISVEKLAAREDQHLGITLHALGDSFAHTYWSTWSESWYAYGPARGHGVDGHAPDQIRYRYQYGVYPAYVRTLGNVFKLNESEKQRMEEMISLMETEDNEGTLVFKKSRMECSTDAHEIAALRTFAVTSNKINGKTDNYVNNELASGNSPYFPETGQLPTLGHISFAEMNLIMNEIERNTQPLEQ